MQFFKKKKIPCYGIDPSKKAALQAKKKGIPMIIDFFNTKISKKLKRKNMEADFIIANNVLAHVPNINDFVKGIKILLKTAVGHVILLHAKIVPLSLIINE